MRAYSAACDHIHPQQETPPRRRGARWPRALVLPLVLAGVLAQAPLATAGTITNHHGNICKNTQPAEATLVAYTGYGARALAPGTMTLTCPVTRRTTNANGAIAYVDLKISYDNGPQFVQCGLVSYDYNNIFLGSTNANWTGTGFHELVLNLVGPGNSTAWSDYLVSCIVPFDTFIYGVDLNEQ